MNRLRFGIVAFGIALVIGLPAFAEYTVVRYEKPIHAHHLEGIVVDPGGAPLPGVAVEDVDETAGKVLARATTDGQGRFAFAGAKPGTTHFLHLKARGFNPLEIVIKIGRLPRHDILLKMPIGG